MVHLPAGHDEESARSADGDVRVNDSGRVEIFDGTAWVPLQRLSDTEPPSVFRGDSPAHPSSPDETGCTDNADSS